MGRIHPIASHHIQYTNTQPNLTQSFLLHCGEKRPQSPQISHNLALSQLALPVHPVDKGYRDLGDGLCLLAGSDYYFHLEGVVAGDAGGDQGFEGGPLVETEGAG